METRNERSTQTEAILSRTFNKLDKTFSWYREQTPPQEKKDIPHLHIPLCIGFKEASTMVEHFSIVVDALLLEKRKRDDSANAARFTFTVYLYCNPNDPDAVKTWKEKNPIVQKLSNIVDIHEWREANLSAWQSAELKWKEVWDKIGSPEAGQAIQQFGASQNKSFDKDVVRFLAGLSPKDKEAKKESAKASLINEIIDGLAWCSKERVNILLHEGKIPGVLQGFLHNLALFGYSHQRDLIYQDFALRKEMDKFLVSSSALTAPIDVPRSKASPSSPGESSLNKSPESSINRYIIDSALKMLGGSLQVQGADPKQCAEAYGAFVKAASSGSSSNSSRSSSKSNSRSSSPTQMSEVIDRRSAQASPSSTSDDYSGESASKTVEHGSTVSGFSSIVSSVSSSSVQDSAAMNNMAAPVTYGDVGVRSAVLFGNATSRPVTPLAHSYDSALRR